MRDEELFPADLMCLHSELPENVCYIKTTNLDGETNLKIRKPLDLKGLPVGARGKGGGGRARGPMRARGCGAHFARAGAGGARMLRSWRHAVKCCGQQSCSAALLCCKP